MILLCYKWKNRQYAIHFLCNLLKFSQLYITVWFSNSQNCLLVCSALPALHWLVHCQLSDSINIQSARAEHSSSCYFLLPGQLSGSFSIQSARAIIIVICLLACFFFPWQHWLPFGESAHICFLLITLSIFFAIGSLRVRAAHFLLIAKHKVTIVQVLLCPQMCAVFAKCATPTDIF